MAISNFIPEVWSAALQEEFRQAVIFAGLTNRQFTGDAAVGNTVKITTAIPVEVKDYKEAGRTTSPDGISTTQIDLVIDQEKSFDFLIDDIDLRQAAGGLAPFAKGASFGLAEDADKWIAKQIYNATVAKDDSPGTAAVGSLADNGKAAWNVIRDLRKTLNQNHTPAGSRVLVINAEFEALLLGFDSKLTAVELAATTPSGMRDAFLGRVLGFNVYTSENLPVTAKAQALAFHTSAYGFVNQLTKTEAMRAEKSFSDRLRGLNVYGGVAVRPKAIASFTAN
jgi:hypothetical protein